MNAPPSADASDEVFDLVDETGAVVGWAPRHKVHGDPSLLHPVVHCAVLNSRGELLLQLRAKDKQVQPGKWDISVGGHVARGEAIDAALAREMLEEIGVAAESAQPQLLYRWLWRTDFESELVYTYACLWEGALQRQEAEIDALRYWSRAEMEAATGSGQLTPNLEVELQRLGQTDLWR